MNSAAKKKTAIALLALAIAGGSLYAYVSRTQNSGKPTEQEMTAEVRRGDIRFTISGTSQLEPKDMQTIIAPSDGTIKSIRLSRIKNVKQGELLFEVSSPTLDTNYQKAQVTLNQLNKELNDLKQQMNSLQTKAPIGGKLVYANNIDVGTTVTKTTKLATISDLNTLTVNVPFPLEDAVQFTIGDSIDLFLDGFMLTKTGRIQSIGRQPKADAKGGKIIDVEVSVPNDSTMDAGMKAKGEVRIGERIVKSTDLATLQYSSVVTVLANVAGSIGTFPFKSGMIVQSGDILSTIVNDTIGDDVANKQTAVDQQRIAVSDLKEKVDALKVKAPFDGVFSTDFVNKKTNILNSVTVGSKVTTNTQFGGVASLDNMQLPIQVDELDLPSVKAGLKADVRVDSMPDRVFQAEVNQVSSVGNTVNGVTFFDVALAVKNTRDLKYGMTATGEILVKEKKNALLLPIEAIQQKQGKRYVTLVQQDGTVNPMHEVKIGIRSKTDVEIAEGLNESDRVIIPTIQKLAEGTPQENARLRQQFQPTDTPPAATGGAGGGAGGANAGAKAPSTANKK
ncbi:efflux RND transporter periplasmic adaptor subunit [Paenibacillus allorhizosphaerae]|uniref:Multidrug resistance protein MdtA n=1 Tax=Paenibacillus allorhizosphaerae TaxID=2849866 RepID=A0ABM8VQ25_9BACL|nr:efflux RND transporter periplasmic adaptor subunit [Paenibacillus allorhizosphaerae]CAG7653662.1 Multidrug resistance protein MdtA [Paenibacillus allorhizosphaerae]